MVLVLICVLGSVILSLPIVQTRFAKYATTEINKEFGTNINIERLRISLISWDTSLQGVYIEDYKDLEGVNFLINSGIQVEKINI